MPFLRVHKPNKPCLEEICEAELAEDKLGVQQLDLIRELFHVNLRQFTLSLGQHSKNDGGNPTNLRLLNQRLRTSEIRVLKRARR